MADGNGLFYYNFERAGAYGDYVRAGQGAYAAVGFAAIQLATVDGIEANRHSGSSADNNLTLPYTYLSTIGNGVAYA